MLRPATPPPMIMTSGVIDFLPCLPFLSRALDRAQVARRKSNWCEGAIAWHSAFCRELRSRDASVWQLQLSFQAFLVVAVNDLVLVLEQPSIVGSPVIAFLIAACMLLRWVLNRSS